jgi:hypothetical protein
MFRAHYHISTGAAGRRKSANEITSMSDFEELSRRAADRVRHHKDTQDVFSVLAEAAQSCPSETMLAKSVAQLLATDRLAGQFAVRACRSTFSVAPFTNDVSLMLLALPSVVARWSPDAGPAVSSEIQSWLQNKWLGFEHPSVRVSVSNTPVPPEVVEAALGGTQVNWAHKLSTEGSAPGEWPAKQPAPFAPALWMVALRVPSDMVDNIQMRLQKPVAMDAATSAFKHRMDALAEEKGALVSVMPPVSWSNAFSVARASAFRLQAQAVSRAVPAGTALNIRFDGVQLITQTPSGKTMSWGLFPEETRDDIEHMLTQTQSATKLQLSLKAN